MKNCLGLIWCSKKKMKKNPRKLKLRVSIYREIPEHLICTTKEYM